MNEPQVINVFSVSASQEANVFVVEAEIGLGDETFTAPVAVRPDDPYGLGPVLRQWMIDNEGTYEIAPYVEPVVTDEERRAAMQPVTARQLRLALVRNGYSLATVTAAISAMPESEAKDEAQIEWEYATTFVRLNPTLLAIASALGLTGEQVDTMWEQALAI